jgi:16S rRNA (guanine527-N7)-methyltransferase
MVTLINGSKAELLVSSSRRWYASSFSSMQSDRIAELLQPFLTTSLNQMQLKHISMYIDILVKWNSRMNLTAVRSSGEIVTRHFGESLFAAQQLFPAASGEGLRVVDVGSGAGFPGLPIAIWNQELAITLIESNQKKATFLRAVVRALGLDRVDVVAGRAENFPTASADVVTMRAVERFEIAVKVAAKLVKPGGQLALLIGNDQTAKARELLGSFTWRTPIPVPESAMRVLMIGERESPRPAEGCNPGA